VEAGTATTCRTFNVKIGVKKHTVHAAWIINVHQRIASALQQSRKCKKQYNPNATYQHHTVHNAITIMGDSNCSA
jgi:hypothetical protein